MAESFNTSLFSQHTHPKQKGYFVVKNLFMQILKISEIKKNRLTIGMANSINTHLKLKSTSTQHKS